MAGNSHEAPKGNEGFDPYRRRREIELMEQRFRERAERSAGPVSTSEIDQRVSDEMKQFFSESAERAAKVVPALEDRPGGGMRETTGEIRKKIDDFFAQVKDAGGGEAAPNTQELVARRPRWQGYIAGAPSRPAVPATPPRPEPTSAASSRGDMPVRPTLTRNAPPGAGPAVSRVAQPAPAAAPAPAYTPPPTQQVYAPPPAAPYVPQPAAPFSSPAPAPADAGGAKMDLKSALERLRRSGNGKPDPTPVPAGTPGPAATVTPPMPQSAAPSAPAASVAPAARAPAPEPARPTTIPPRPAHFGAGASAIPAARSVAPTPAAPAPASARAPFVPPRREPTVRGLPSLRAESVAPGTGPVTTSVPVVPPRREPTRPVPLLRPESLAADAAQAALRSPPAVRPPAPGAAAAPESLPAALRRIEAPARPTARPEAPGVESEKRPHFAPSAAAAARASSVKKAAARGVLRPDQSVAQVPVDRTIPRSAASSAAAPAAPAAERKPESPIRVVRHHSVVEMNEAVDEKALRGPSAAAQAFAAGFKN